MPAMNQSQPTTRDCQGEVMIIGSIVSSSCRVWHVGCIFRNQILHSVLLAAQSTWLEEQAFNGTQ